MGGGGADGGTPVTGTLVTVQQAAVWVARDERTVRRWITQGLLVDHQTASGRRVVLQEALAVEVRVRTAPRRRQMERLASLLDQL